MDGDIATPGTSARGEMATGAKAVGGTRAVSAMFDWESADRGVAGDGKPAEKTPDGGSAAEGDAAGGEAVVEVETNAGGLRGNVNVFGW